MIEKKSGPWRAKESPFVKRKPGEYRPGKTKRDYGRSRKVKVVKEETPSTGKKK